MARVVLPVVGAVVGAFYGNPQLGWAIGSAIAGVVDPQVIQGPRIGEVSQQTSQEGGPRPIIFGLSPPISGNIIATSEPRIVRRKQSQGKGGPKVETESVYRTYAVGISEGEVDLRRAWRNGILVYNADNGLSADNLKFLDKARFFSGTFSQNPSPDLEAIFGVGTTPAHRGTAYLVVADDDLTDLRGAIPQWTFQVGAGISSQLLMLRGSGLKRSVDGGITWNDEMPATLSGLTLNDVAFSPSLGRIVAIHKSTHSPQVIRYSDDGGLTWVAAANPAPSGTFAMGGIIWSSSTNRFVIPHAGGDSAARIAMSSLDGSDWSVTPTATLSLDAFNSVVQLEDRIVAYFGNRVCWSFDGTTWSNAAISQNLSSPAMAAYSPSLDLIVLASGNRNTTWSSAGVLGVITDASPNPGNISTVAWSANLGKFANHGFSPWYSSDGKGWTQGIEIGGISNMTIWSPLARRFVSCGYLPGPTSQIFTSDDGINWISRNSVGGYEGLALVEIGGHDPDAPVYLDDLITSICERVGLDSLKVDVSLLGVEVRGFMITNEYPAYASLKALSEVFQFDPSNYDGVLHFVPRGGISVATITEAEMVDDDADIEQERRADAIAIPRVMHLNYHDVAGGLNTDKQSSERAGDRRSMGEVSLQTAVILAADEAARVVAINHKALIEDQKGELKFSLPDSLLKLAVANPIIVQRQGKSDRVRITKCDIQDGYQEYTCVRDRQSAYTANVEGIPAAPLTPPPSSVVGPTLIEPLDIHVLRDADDALGLGYYVAISGLLDAWQGATVELSLDGGANYIDESTWNVAAVMGETTSVLADHPQSYPDEVNSVSVRIDTPNAELLETDLEGLLNRQNLAIIGNEMIQFAIPDETSEGEWSLSYFLRGRKGTATAEHAIGERFVLLDRSAIPFIPAELVYLGKTLTFRATSFGTTPDTGTVVSVAFDGITQTERQPAYLSAHRDGTDLVMSWQGVGRLGAGAQSAQGAYFLGYRVTISDGVLTETFDTLNQSLTEDISGFTGPLTVRVQQRNQFTGFGPFIEVIV